MDSLQGSWGSEEDFSFDSIGNNRLWRFNSLKEIKEWFDFDWRWVEFELEFGIVRKGLVVFYKIVESVALLEIDSVDFKQSGDSSVLWRNGMDLHWDCVRLEHGSWVVFKTGLGEEE